MGQQSQAGAELARMDLLESGTKIQIIYEDHRTDAKTGLTAAKKLIEVDKVDAVLCDLTPPCIAASSLIASAKRLMLYQAPVVSIRDSNPYAFKNFLDYEDGCKRIATYWKRAGIERVAHFKVNAEFGELCLKGAREIYPDEVVFDYDPNDDLRPLVLRLRALNIQAVFQTGYEGDYINRLKASADIGLSLPTAMPQPLLTSTVLQAVSPAQSEQAVVFGFPGISQMFLDRLRTANLFRSDVSIESAAIAYSHVKQVSEALVACPPHDIDCELAHVAAAPPNELLSFKGWKDRAASYDYVLRKWTGREFIDISRDVRITKQ